MVNALPAAGEGIIQLPILTDSANVEATLNPNCCEPILYQPEVGSVAQVRPGAPTTPSANFKSPVIAAEPSVGKLPVRAKAMSLMVLFAQVDEIVVRVTTGLPAGRV
jgi:hypothetical protein